MHKLAGITLTTTFAAVIGAPLAGGLLGVDSPWRTVENRVPAPRPAWPDDLETLATFPTGVDRWLEDGFAFRGAYIRANSLLRYALFGETYSELVLPGRDGWLFLTAGELRLHYEGRRPWRPEELEIRAGLVEQMRERLGAHGIPFAWLVAPNKASIYPERLPEGLPGQDTITELVSHVAAHSTALVVECATPLREAKPRELLYYPRGTHWTSHGAYIAYRELLESLGRAPRPRDAFEVRRIPQPDDGLAHAAALEGLYEEDFVELVPSWRDALRREPLPLEEMGWTGGVREPLTFRIVNPGETGKVVVFRDSFWEQLEEFVAGHFAECLLIGARAHPDLIDLLVEHERPDVVIEQVVERNV